MVTQGTAPLCLTSQSYLRCDSKVRIMGNRIGPLEEMKRSHGSGSRICCYVGLNVNCVMVSFIIQVSCVVAGG